MKKNEKNMASPVDEDLDVPEFDFDGAERNPYAEAYRKGVIVTVFQPDGSKERYVRLDADVAKKFRSSKSVNDALRLAMKQTSQRAA